MTGDTKQRTAHDSGQLSAGLRGFREVQRLAYECAETVAA